VPATLAWIAIRNDALCDELEDIKNVGILDRCIRLGYGKAIEQVSEHPTPQETKLLLQKALRSGDVKAWAIKDRSGDLVLIGPGEWNGLDLRDDCHLGIIAEMWSHRAGCNLNLSDIRIDISDVKRHWPCKELEKFTELKELSEEFWSQPSQWPHGRKGYVFLAQAAYQVSGVDNWLAIGSANPSLRMPLQESRGLLAIAAADGEIQTAVRPIAGGAFHALSQDLWNSEHINSRFKFCQMKLEDPYSYNPRGTHWIFVKRESLQSCIADLFAPSNTIPDRAPREERHESDLLSHANADGRSKSITSNNLVAKVSMPEEAISLMNGGEPPITAKLARKIHKNPAFKGYSPNTIEKYIRPAVAQWKSRNRSPENPENPGTAV